MRATAANVYGVRGGVCDAGVLVGGGGGCEGSAGWEVEGERGSALG